MVNIVKFQLNMPKDFVRILDAEVQARIKKNRPLSKLEWLHKTPEGQALMQKALDPKGPYRSLSSTQINEKVDNEYIAIYGAPSIGRPSLHDQRVALIVEAVYAHLGVKNPDNVIGLTRRA